MADTVASGRSYSETFVAFLRKTRFENFPAKGIAKINRLHAARDMRVRRSVGAGALSCEAVRIVTAAAGGASDFAARD